MDGGVEVSGSRYYITTAIPYVNAKPHIGFALELVQTDVLARYHRLIGDDTRFLTGTDDNALKNVQAAEAEGISTKELVDRNAELFKALREPLAVSFDDFIRTSGEKRHIDGVQKLWRACQRSGDIYKRVYKGLYCVGCEQFYSEEELVNGLCPEHLTRPELVEEENYFFRLSKYTDRLISIIESGELRILPETRRNEVLSFIRRGLEDFSISRASSRARGWGIPVPDDPDQVMYVWFDALGNYITALDYAYDGELYRRYWLENPHRTHVIGKGILRFHAVYWPAMLLSAGEPLPTTIYVHEYLTINGQKISKSLGNVIDPISIVERFGTDALRYWFVREVSRTEDTDFTWDRLVTRYNADLANDLGNLLNRTVSMIRRYREGKVPSPSDSTDLEQDLMQIAEGIPEKIYKYLDEFDLRAAITAVWDLVTRANRYVEESAPWLLARQEKNGDGAASSRLDTVLYSLAESLRVIAVHLSPFLPLTSSKILEQLGIGADSQAKWPDVAAWGRLQPGTLVGEPKPIFPRVELNTSEIS